MFALTTSEPQEQVSSASAAIGRPFVLIDTSGKTVTDQTYRGRWMVIYFGYTYCPDACPTTLTNLSDAPKKLGPQAKEIELLFVTVDPERDTSQVMGGVSQIF